MVKSFTFLVLFIVVIAGSSNAQTYYSQGDANFSVLGNWNTIPGGGGTSPASIGNFTFVIQNGHTVTQTVNISIGSLSVEVGGVFLGNVGTTLEVTGDVTANGSLTHNGTFSFADGAANTDFNGIAIFNTLIIDKSPSSERVILNAGSDQITASSTELRSGTLGLTNINSASNFGTVTGSTGTHIYVNGGNIANWDNLGDFSAYMSVGGTEIRYVGSGSYNVPALIDGVNYKIVSFTDGGTKTLASATSVDEDLTVLSSTNLTLQADLIVNGNIQLNNNAVLDNGGFTHTIGGNWIENDAGAMIGTGTIHFTAGAHQITTTGGTLDFHNITAEAGATLSFDATATINITGNFSTFGNCNNLVTINSVVGGNQADLNISTSPTWDAVSVVDINETGAGTITINQGTISNTTNIAAPAGTCDLKYWVGADTGCDGTWNDGDCWSTTSGGAGGAGQPTATEDAIFDTNSFDASHTLIRIDANGATCKNMTWTGVTNNPTFNRSGGNQDNRRLQIHGSLILSVNMNWDLDSDVDFRGAGSFSITSAGNEFRRPVRFNNTGGEWILLDAINLVNNGNGVLELEAGVLRTNGNTVTSGRIDASVNGDFNRGLDFSSSNIILTRVGDGILDIRGNNLNFNAGTSTITFTNTGTDRARVELGTADRTFYNIVSDVGRHDREVEFRNGSDAAIYIANNITVNSTRGLRFNHSVTVNGTITTAVNSNLQFRGANNIFNGAVNIASITNGSYNIRFGDAESDVNTFNAAVTIAGATQDTDRIRFYQSTFNSTVTLNGTDPRARFYANCNFNGFFSSTGSTRFYDDDRFYAGASFGDFVTFTQNNQNGESTQFIGNFPVTFPDNTNVESERDISFGGTLTIGNSSTINFTDRAGDATFDGNVIIGNNVIFNPQRDAIFNADLIFGDGADARFNQDEGTTTVSGVTTFGNNTVEAWFEGGSTHSGDVTFGTGSGSGGEHVRFGGNTIIEGKFTIAGTANQGDALRFDADNEFRGGFEIQSTAATNQNVRFFGDNLFRGGAVLLTSASTDWAIDFEQDAGTATFETTAPVTLSAGTHLLIDGASDFRGDLVIGDNCRVRFADNAGTSLFANVTNGDNVFFEAHRTATFSGNLIFGDGANTRFNVDDVGAANNITTINGVTTFGNNTIQAWFDRNSTHVGAVTFGTNTGTGGEEVRFDGTSIFQGGFLLQGTPDSDARVRFWGTNTFSGGTVDFTTGDADWVVDFDDNTTNTFAVDAPVIFRANSHVRFRGNDTFNGTVTGEDNVRVRFTGDWNNARTTIVNNTFTFGDNAFINSYHNFSVTGDVIIGNGADFHITDNTGSSSFGGTVTFGNNTIEAHWDRAADFTGKVTLGTNSGTGGERVIWDGTTNFDGGLEIQGTANVANAVRFWGVKNFAGDTVDITSSATQWTVDFDDNTTVTAAADAPVIIRNGSHVRFRGDDTFNGTFTAEDNVNILFTGDWGNEGSSNFNGVTTFGNNVRLESYHTFNCGSTLTIGDNAYVHITNNRGSASFTGAVQVGANASRFMIDRASTFASTFSLGDNATGVIFANGAGSTTFNGDADFGQSSNIRFDRRITANNQNITIGAETRLELNTRDSPNTLHNLTLTQGNEVIFERQEDYNFTGQIIFSGAQDCTAAHFIRSDDWNRQARLSFSTAHTWYGAILQRIDVTTTNITAQNSTNYRGNTGITFDGSYVNTSNAGAGSQDLYWIGGHSGNVRNWPFAEWWNIDDWNNPQNWSTTSGGASGSCIPQRQHNVIFDANSFDDGTNLLVEVNTATAAAHDMTWTAGVLNNPDLRVNNSLELNGSLSLSSNPMIVSGGRDITFTSTSNETITSNGKTIGNDDIILNGVGGSWIIQDNFTMGDKLMLQAGTFIIPDGITAAVDEFEAYRNRGNPTVFFTEARTLTLGNNAVLQIDGGNGDNDPGFDFRGNGFTLTNPGTGSKIVLATPHTVVNWFDVWLGSGLNADASNRIIPDIEIGIDADTGPDDVNFHTENNNSAPRLTFREIRRVSTNVAMNFELIGSSPKTYGNINMGDNMNHRPGNNFFRGSTTEINYFTGTVDFGNDADMRFQGLNHFAQDVTFGNNNDIEFQQEGHYFTNGASLTFSDDADFEADYDLHFTGTDGGGLPGDFILGTNANARINNEVGSTFQIDGSVTIGTNANEVVFRRTGIYNGAVSIGDNAIVQFSTENNNSSTFNNTVTTGTESDVRFRRDVTFNDVLTTGTDSRSRFAEWDNHETIFNANATLGVGSNNTFSGAVTFDPAGTSPDFLLTYGANSINFISGRGDGNYDDILLNSGASVTYRNLSAGSTQNTYNDVTLTTFNTFEFVSWRVSTITGVFTASVGCDAWAIVRSSDQGNQASINFTNPQTWNNIVVQDLNVVNASALLTITDGVNLRNLADVDGTATTNGTDGDPATIVITERAPLHFYWTANGGDGLWSNDANWALGSSSGASNGCIPNPIDDVTFDDGSFNPGDNLTVNVNISNAACFTMTWDLDEDVELSSPNATNRLMVFNDLNWDQRIDNQFSGIVEFQSNARYEQETSGSFTTNILDKDDNTTIDFNGGVEFDGDQDQAIGNWSLQVPIDINEVPGGSAPNFRVINGIFDANQQAINVEGDFTIEDASQYLYDNDGTGVANTAGSTQTVTFDGDRDNVNIYMRDDDNENPFYNIVVDKDNAQRDVRIRTEHFRIENDLTITQGRFWDSDEWNGGPFAITNVAETNGTGGTITITANGSLMLGDRNNEPQSEFPLVFSAVNLDPASTVVYRGRREQRVTALNDYWAGVQYGNLTLTNGERNVARAKQLQGDITVRGNLRIEDDTYFFDNGHQVTGNTGGTSSFAMIGDARFYIGNIGSSTNMPEFDTYNFENNSWVYYESDQVQGVKGISGAQGSYANVMIRNDNNAAVTDPVVKTLDAEMRVRRRLRIGSDTEFWDNGNQIIVDAADRGNRDCEITMYADSYFRLGNATSATTFPDFENNEISLEPNSTVIYNAGVAQEIRRLSDGTGNRNYWNLWLLNSAIHPTGSIPVDGSSINPSVLAQKTLNATVPATGQPGNLRFRNEFRIEPFVHVSDAGYQIRGNESDDTDIVRIDEHSVLTLGIADDATQFPRHTTVANIDLHETSHIIYNAGLNQTVRGISNLAGNNPTGNSNYGFLTITNIADAAMRDKTLDEAIGVRRTFVVNNNVDVNDAGFQIYGVIGETLDVNGNGMLTLGVAATATEFPLNYTNADIDLESTTTVVYNAGVAQEVRRLSSATANQNYANLTVRNDGGSGTVTKTLTASPTTADGSTNVQVRGSLQVHSNANFVDDGHQIVGRAGQIMELQSASQLTIGNATVATVFPENYTDADLNIDASSIVEYSAGDAQNVRGLNSATDSQVYGEIHFNNASDKTLLAALRFRTNMLMYTANNVYDAGFQITGANGATFEMQGNSQFYIGDAVQVGVTRFPLNVLNEDVNLSATSTIHYQDNEPQLVRKLGGAVGSVQNYGNLILTNSIKTIAATPNATAGYLDNLHVRGNLNLGAVNLTLNDQRLVLSGTLARTTGAFVGSDDSKLTIRGSGALGAELHFDTPGVGSTDISDLLINRTGGVTITLGTNLIVGTNPGFNGSVTLTEGVLALNNQRLFINSGANQFNRTNGTFNGGGAGNNSVLVTRGTGAFGDAIVFTGDRELRVLGIDRTGTSSHLVMGSQLTINHNLGLTNGIIRTTNVNIIRMEANASVRDFDTDVVKAKTSIHPNGAGSGSSGFGSSGGSHDSHIQGPIEKVFSGAPGDDKGFRFPVGKAGKLREIGVAEVGKPDGATATWPTVFRAEYINSAHSKPGQSALKSGTNMTHVSSVEYWNLDRIEGNAAARVIMHWDTDTDVASDASFYENLRVAHFDGADWESIGESNERDNASGEGYIVSPDFTDDFSPFTFGSTSLLNLLPIELKSFNAKLKEDRTIELTWEAVESDSEGYILKRSIGDTDNFKDIASYIDNQSLVSKNDSESISSYVYLDENNIQPGEVHYYMLEQVDKDGNVISFDIQAVNVGAKVVLYQNHPNPASHTTKVSFSIEKEARTRLQVFDMSGRFITTIVNEVLDVGTHQYDLDVSDFQTGVYTVKMTYGNKLLNIKMLVSR